MGFFGISGARDGTEPIATGGVFAGFVWFASLSMPPKMPPKRKVPPVPAPMARFALAFY